MHFLLSFTRVFFLFVEEPFFCLAFNISFCVLLVLWRNLSQINRSQTWAELQERVVVLECKVATILTPTSTYRFKLFIRSMSFALSSPQNIFHWTHIENTPCVWIEETICTESVSHCASINTVKILNCYAIII